MSIGLCIDFATHVGYRIYRSKHVEPNARIADALGAIGWPVMQAGISTFLGLLKLLFKYFVQLINVLRLFKNNF